MTERKQGREKRGGKQARKQEYDKEKNDRYGRTLAYVWLSKNRMFNRELVEKGLAREKYYSPNGKYRNILIKAQEEAKQNKVNLWS